MARDPVLWLACRERWQSLGIWIFAVIVMGLLVAMFALELPQAEAMLWTWIGSLCAWVLYLWAASQANRFFVEARRSGLIELVLATPLPVRDIVQGQWRAFGRLFGAPVILILLLNLSGSFLGQHFSWSGLSGTLGTAPSWLITLGSVLLRALSTSANLLALLWFGMWMGLTSKNYSLATMKTLAFVQVIPTLVITFASSIGVMVVIMPIATRGALAPGKSGMPTASVMSWFPLVAAGIGGLLTLAKDVGFIVWARRRLYSMFREQASRGMAPLRPVPPAVPPPVIPPSTIPAPRPVAVHP